MEYIYIGKIVSTHGIKGEIRIISDFEYKPEVFKEDINIYIGEEKKKEIITGYRHHKNYEMITLEGYNNIDQVMKFMKKKVYVDRNDIESLKDKILIEDLIGIDAYIEEEKIGIVNDIYCTGNNYYVFEIINDIGKKLIPYNYDFIDKIDKDNKKIIFKGGMI